MKLELHCHSIHSDGSFAPTEVASKAEAFGVELFALTDHDSMAGYDEVRAALPRVRVLRSLELSCRHHRKTVHLLVHDVKDGPGCDALQARLEHVRENRVERLRKIVERFAKLGITLDAEALVARAHGRTAGRPDVARALLEAGIVKTPREAFDRFLHDGGPADVPVERVTVAEGLALARACGAKVGLAHPDTLRSWEVVKELFLQHRSDGLEGIEACYGRYANAQREPWLRLAQELDLVVTAGSDFHGDMVPEVRRPGIELGEPHASRLRQWLGVDERQ